MSENDCYEEVFYKLKPYGDLKRLVKTGDLKKLHKRVYSILCTEYQPSYYEEENTIINYIHEKFLNTDLIIFPQRETPFSNVEEIENYINVTSGNYFFFLKNQDLPVNRRIVINTETQKEARLVLDKLISLINLEKHQISRVKIFLRSDPFNRIKKDKIVVYYSKSTKDIQIDENGKEIVSELTKILATNDTDYSFPFYKKAGNSGIAWGDDYKRNISFSVLRCEAIALAVKNTNLSKVKVFIENLKEEFAKLGVDENLPHLNKNNDTNL